VLGQRRLVKPLIALIATGAVVLAVSGCAFVKFHSLAVSQPQGIGTVRVHFNLCTINLEGEGITEICGPNKGKSETFQYLVGIAVPPGSTPPASFTAVPIGGGAPIAFTRNDELVAEMSASAAAIQKLLGELKPEEIEKVQALLIEVFGGPWPPSGLQGVGYISAPVLEAEGASGEWSVDADFGLPTAAGGGPFPGPFVTAIAYGVRAVSASQPANRAVRCARLEKETKALEGEAFCSGAIQQAQVGTSDLQIAGPAKPVKAFVGGKAKLAFQLKFATTAAAVPTFALSATTTAKGGKAKPASKSFTPGEPGATTHQSPTGTDKVTVSLSPKTKPKTYTVTLTASTPQGGSVSQVAKLKVTKPKLKFGATKLDLAKGTATLKIKVPSGGKLTIAGKGVAKVKKKAKKAKTLKVKIAPTGSGGAQLGSAGKVKVKVKATFKPTSGISVSKTKSVVLKLR